MLNTLIQRLIPCLLSVCLLSPITYATPLNEQIDNLIEQTLPHATIGIFIKDAKTNQIIYRKNANKLLFPASSIKLLTAAAALYQWHPEIHFNTILSQKDQTIYLTFNGSPSLTADDLKTLLINLKKNNINLIKGDIILETSRFKPPYYPDGVSYDDLGWYYNAPDTAVILNENMEAYDFISAKNLDEPIQIKSHNTQEALTLINHVTTVDKSKAKNHCSLNIEMKPNNTLRLFGCLAQSAEPKTMKLAIPDPILSAKKIIQQILDDNQIILKGKILDGHTPIDAKLLASIPSNNLTQLVTEMLQNSNNLYANSLTKQLGYALTEEGTYKQGAFAIKKILAENTTLDMNQLELADGMGTRYNLVTPEQLVILLTDIYHDKKHRQIFLNALPKAAVSGTLEDRLKKTPLEKKVLAKTGSMHDVSSLSGYIIRPDANPIIFSIIINGINKPLNIAKTLEDKILLLIQDEYINKHQARIISTA
ncbi:MAG: D-alanyl-D-alanine carboxypeptidase/D-alanyl-D-alanine-endopeptidase [Gammaproteobacteria bacterium]|nr:D-alanyl-D-alanine carboxypeptidase/D-alanyl-D-alanine-endopeptidase [Gammaproteobacteria bacterium]